ncbi:MAG: glycosyltransferase family 1 protein, partial [Epsilonproteobacteria bacterium]|nr:glycosyltransferase family 1 protein [Campylobacterota bacterium]NPA65091.1 glycosyltransferase family 4 protein [Campylobacterota bacterium]
GDAGILVDPDDEEALARHLQRLDTDETLRLILSKKGRKRAKLFSWKDSAKKLYETARDVAKT